MKTTLDSLLSSRKNQLWERVKQYIDSLPDGEAVDVHEIASSINSTKSSLNTNLQFSVDEIQERSIVLTRANSNIDAPQKRVFANVRTIKQLRKALGNNYENNGQPIKAGRESSRTSKSKKG